MRKFLLLFLFLLAINPLLARDRQLFDSGWLFVLGNDDDMAKADYDDSAGDFSICHTTGP